MKDMTERRLFFYGMLILVLLFASEYSSRILSSFLSDKALASAAYDINCSEKLIPKACEEGFHLAQREFNKYLSLIHISEPTRLC